MDDDLDFDRLGRDEEAATTPSPAAPAAPSADPLGRVSVGEVIAAGYDSFTAESFRLHDLPPLGGVVVVENVLGVVYEARTEGLGPLSVRGGPADADGAVYRAYPDLERTLRSQFSALIIGHYSGMPQSGASLPRVVYTYPDSPPRVHYKAGLAGEAELRHVTEQPQYLRLLLQVPEW